MRNEHGRPVSGAEIEVAPAQVTSTCPSPDVGSSLNLIPGLGQGAPGRFESPDSSRGIALVTAPGYAPRVVAIQAGTRVRLARGNDVRLDVLDAAGEPLAGHLVSLVPLSVCTSALERFRSKLTHSASTGIRGEVELRNVGAGTYAARASRSIPKRVTSSKPSMGPRAETS